MSKLTKIISPTDVTLVRTCCVCPEQYDAFCDGNKIAYLRLRHGHFYASCPDVGGQHVFDAEPEGDGMFDDDERDEYLHRAICAICNYYNSMLESK